MKKLLIFAGLLWAGTASAQFTPGQILTAQQLNSQFALYAPLAGANFSGLVTAAGITGTPISGSTGSFTNLTVSGLAVFPAGAISLSGLAAQSANTVVANATGSTASPSAVAIPSCSTSSSALTWLSNSGFTCNTSVNAGTLGGATFASPGPIGSGTPNTIAGTTASLNSGGTSAALSVQTSGAQSSLNITDTTGGVGASIKITGNGATTPSKYIRVENGALQFLNSAFSSVIGQITDAGDLSAVNIDSTPIGQTVASAGSFTNLSASGTVTGVTGTFVGVQVFNSSCSGGCTYTPDTGTRRVVVEAQGPGGGGGGAAATSTGQSAAAAGGGNGAYCKVLLTSSFSGVTVTVPVGGAGGTAGANNGTAGAAATFGSLISATGGTAGLGGSAVGSAGATGSGAASAACTISSGTVIANTGGTAGGIGMVISAGAAAYSGQGASSPFGNGGQSRAGATGAGISGGGNGAGGGGGINASASQPAVAGGQASQGLIAVWEYE